MTAKWNSLAQHQDQEPREKSNPPNEISKQLLLASTIINPSDIATAIFYSDLYIPDNEQILAYSQSNSCTNILVPSSKPCVWILN